MAGISNSADTWVRRFHRNPQASVQLVCFPHAGGSASYFFPLSEALAPDIEALAIQYPGRQDRRSEGCIDSIPELADRAFEAMRGLGERPFAFFGHSLGSVLAFEVARRFQAATGPQPSWLFASGYPAPSRLRGGTVHLRDDAGLVTELLSTGGTDPRWLQDEDLLATILPAVRSDYRAIETHRRTGDAVLDCPITMLVGDADPHTTADEAAAWREHTRGEFALRTFPGGHFYLDPHRDGVIETITATLAGDALSLSADGGAR